MGLHSPPRPVGTPAGDPGAIPEASAEAVEVYRRTYLTLLRSTGETRLRVLEASHRATRSSLHPLADSAAVDLGAFLYACRRLPDALAGVHLVVMGQSAEVFVRHGFVFDDARGPGHLHPTAQPPGGHPLDPPPPPPRASWTAVDAPGRRRRWYHDGAGTLAVLVASASDVDDLVPTLVAYQIEWNKLRTQLRAAGVGRSRDTPDWPECPALLGGSLDDWAQLAELWGPAFALRLTAITERSLSLRMRMLGGSAVGYARVTRGWWAPVLELLRREGLADRPVSFVSSNSHSLVNLVTGMVVEQEAQIVAWVASAGPDDLRDELERFREGAAQGEWANFLYYAARLWMRTPGAGLAEARRRREAEQRLGVFHIASTTALNVSAQVIALDRLEPGRLDARLPRVDCRRCRGVVVNIDYPLGLAAYNILREVAETVELQGVYVLGKAATLNADVGDVMLSGVVHDEHSGSTFYLDNAFSVDDVAPHLRFGSGLDNQRAVTVKGTFLQNRAHLDFYYREHFTVVEMEAGPYCTAVYEMSSPGRYPAGEAVNFSKLPVDLGIIHYASDTPFTQARTLGARGLSYFGMDSTYAASVAIMRRILDRDPRVQSDPPPSARSIAGGTL